MNRTLTVLLLQIDHFKGFTVNY